MGRRGGVRGTERRRDTVWHGEACSGRMGSPIFTGVVDKNREGYLGSK